ncbi:D-aspartate oxidase [Drosophila guanche]|uniref:Blast:D-aspartate oxidase n=1 Tax=Drosophila guanche TaxID=7266 RepID=A0A3B0JL65_DROGU|nr:D-aspartate oxidase [Drosophila guanche]SPP81573.1 blast:D-aspartate oxidase [Drosophila guanche]
MPNVAVIGAGVNGVASAIKILEHYQREGNPGFPETRVTIISEQYSPNTTGDGSAGLWGPYLLGGTEQSKVLKWSKSMHTFLEQIWLSEDAGEAGVCLLPCIRLSTSTVNTVEDFWRDIVYGAVDLTAEQLAVYNQGRSVKFTSGLSFVTYTSEPIKLLPYLMKRFARNGGVVVQQKVTDLERFITKSPYDVIVNCSGLGSRELLNDDQMYAVRGQVSRVKANWMFTAILDESDDGYYIIPNTESVVLGGTHQERDYNINVCEEDKRLIVDGCQRFVPGLCHTKTLFDWVGLRPGRGKLRLEAERRGQKLLIHNYGHGGSGVTLCWGCADDVLDLLLAAKNISKL